MVTTLLLIRHGQTDAVAQGIMSARKPGVPLNEAGRAEAAAVADALAGAPVTRIYSSPMERAQQTAAYLARLLNLPVALADGMNETDIGEWTGLSREQVWDTDLWKTFVNHPSLMQFPGGESIAGMQERMAAELHSIAARHPGEMIACFSHADPIRVALAYFLHMPLDAIQYLSVDCCSVSVLAFSPDGKVRVRRVNQAAGPLWG